jgi:hypothetical protein
MVFIQLNIDVYSKNPVDKDPAGSMFMLSVARRDVDRRRRGGDDV